LYPILGDHTQTGYGSLPFDPISTALYQFFQFLGIVEISLEILSIKDIPMVDIGNDDVFHIFTAERIQILLGDRFYLHQ